MNRKDSKRAESQAQGPDNFLALKLGKPSKTAAGAKAVGVAMQHVLAEMNPVRGIKALNSLNKVGGIDCPGCAWPDPDDERSALGEYCENGAKAIAEEATEKSIGREFFSLNDVVTLSRLTDYEIGKLGRLSEPLILKRGVPYYHPISWEDAFEFIADFLRNETTPKRSAFYTSGRTSNEAAFLYQLFARQYGTNNLPDCSNMCHESSGVALKQTLGLGKGSVTLDDFNSAEIILIVGQNPGTNHPRMLTALQKAKRNGAKIVSINPLPEAGLMGFSNPQDPIQFLGGSTQLSDLHIPLRINSDVSLFKAILLKLLEKEDENPNSILDNDFIKSKTEGFEEFRNHIKKQKFGPLIKECGVDQNLVLKLVDWLSTTNKFITCWAMGLTQHKNAVDNIREIVNLHLIKGAIGISGAGTCPVRGHSNVQGDRTMGIWEKPPGSFLDKIENVFHFKPPRRAGFNTVEAIEAMKEGDVDFFMAMGGNFLSASPDTELTAEGLRNCKLSVHVSTKLNRTHLIHGETSIILPCLARSDQDLSGGRRNFVTVENSMGIVHKSQGNLKPISESLMSEPNIVIRLAIQLFGQESPVDWQSVLNDYPKIREWIQNTIPGFENYNQRIEQQPSGFYLPNGPRKRVFTTPSKKAQFSVNKKSRFKIPEDHYVMMTIRSHDQFNTTIYGLDDRYRGVYSERRVVFINENDMKKNRWESEQVVNLTSVFNDVEREVSNFKLIPYPIPEGCIATYFPECNPLIPLKSTAHSSHTPTSKSVIVKITPLAR